MDFVLADLRVRDGFVSKDTVAGGYGSRFKPFTRVTRVVYHLKRRYLDVPSTQMAYLAAIGAEAGHRIRFSRGDLLEGDVAVVLSSLVDYRGETAWADLMRARGVRVGFVGLAASKMPQLFTPHADFIIKGEPESAFMRLVGGEVLEGLCESEPVQDLDSLPHPRWDLVRNGRGRWGIRFSHRPVGGGFPLFASRGCPEFCTYCPHRILAGYRARSVGNVLDEIEQLCDRHRRPHVIFRDPLFSQNRDRCLELCDEIDARGLDFTFECETRLDRLDPELIDKLHESGLRGISFGVESVSPQTLKKVGRRPIPEAHQRMIMEHCRKRGITTCGFYVLGFLTDSWQSIAATIEYSTSLGSTLAQFKLLTPYPGTPLWKQMEPLVYEKDWQNFDGYTPTFKHPNLTPEELTFLLGAAYARFYMRPSYLANYLKVQNTRLRQWVDKMDAKASRRHSQQEIETIRRPVTC